jgi:hypothetical protein
VLLEDHGCLLLVLEQSKKEVEPRACALEVRRWKTVLPSGWYHLSGHAIEDPDHNELRLSRRRDLPDDLVWQILRGLSQDENHFNDMQARYRLLASTWLLASLGAIGTLTSTNLASPLPGAWRLIAGIGGAAFVGISILGVLDVGVYHRLLLANYESGREVEYRYAWVPRVRLRMLTRARPAAVLYYAVLGVVELGAVVIAIEALRIRTPTEWIFVFRAVAVALGLFAVAVAFDWGCGWWGPTWRRIRSWLPRG